MKIRFLDAAREEVVEAAAWYERQAGLGEDFDHEIGLAIEIVSRLPETWPLWPKVRDRVGVRRYRLHRFPYSLGYVIRPKEIVVVVVAHDRRRPGYWLRRLRSIE